ncbi:carboxymuconolactone decarboxylase family protein [Streptomyces millisiae]|uniref:Alkyl hydroperoxide reductase AhpD n=1 Tax=Streptomyces millisiae TaxID=3075542 RepID=A0ABU2LTS3_9ACTN|nr:carboxymuconolactone decarboxylase family protein [Streptomyces sp. DSM 44918]MDT0320992.1 carboxymuconolactone decarboxylase family protein [Streptomyces sp. DSM 44918]
MALDDLKSALPDYAKDLRLNLGSVTTTSQLSPQQLWGTLLACAVATRSPRVLRELEPEARGRLSAEAFGAVLAVTATMAMNNVYYRARHQLSDPGYGTLRAGLRMSALADPAVPKADLELWSLAVSAVNGCGQCLDAHEKALRTAGLARETVHDALRVAAVLQAVATTLDAEAALSGAPEALPLGEPAAG